MRSIWCLGISAVLVVAACNREEFSSSTTLADLGSSDLAMAFVPCDEGSLAIGCSIGHCTLSGPQGTIAKGTRLMLAEKPLPAELASDALGSVLCTVAASDGVLAGALELAIHLDAPPPSSGTLFAWQPPAPAALVEGSAPNGQAIIGQVLAAGDYGATQTPDPWGVAGVVGVDVSASGDLASLLRNVSTDRINAAFFDGTHLFVGAGKRLLVYDGLPAGPSVHPKIVLGQPDLDTQVAGLSSSVFDSPVNGIWSDGTRLVVSTGHRVLVWSPVPAVSFAPADLVLGQSDFSSDQSNSGGISASTLFLPTQVDSDGTGLMVADTLNNRVLVWSTFPVELGQPATSVIGQPSFVSNIVLGGATGMYQSWGALFAPVGAFVTGLFGNGVQHVASATSTNPSSDFAPVLFNTKVQPDSMYETATLARVPGGGLAIRDTASQRVAVFRTWPTALTTIDMCIGQPDCSRQVSGVTSASTTFDGNTALGGGGGTLLVPDGHRVLVYEGAPSYHFQPASRVIGQAGPSTNETAVDYRGISARTLGAPADVAVSGGTVAVADRGNNRVLLFSAAAIAAGNAAATVVVGQPDAQSYVPNLDQRTPSAARLSGPGGVALDGTHLIVADTENHRVLVWNTVPTASGQAADLVLGQADATSRQPNRGRGDVSPVDGASDAALDGVFAPTGVASDGTHLVVADRLNHRVLVWSTFPTVSGQAADAVLGQADGVSSLVNRGSGPFAVVPNGFDLPTGVTLDGTTLWVADTENNRVVRWDNVFTAAAPGAFLGQPDGVTLQNSNAAKPPSSITGLGQAQPTSATSVLRPRSVVVSGGRLYVSETSSNRVHMFDASSLAPLGVLGQPGDTTAVTNAGGIGPTALTSPLGLATDGALLYVADAGNHRVVGYPIATAPPTNTAATAFIGQPTPFSNGFDQASSASGGITHGARGLARYGNALYVADTDHNRVLRFDTPVTAGGLPSQVLGQPDGNLTLANAGGAPTASTLQGPRGVYVDAQHVLVADTGNNRVLVYDRAAMTSGAALVLGQSTFSTRLANQGGSPSAATMQAPAGVYSDGTRLWVADTANHRVLGWNAFPTVNGQPADVVLGQADAASGLANRGGMPAAQTLSSPSGIDSVGGALFVADAGNNRVLAWKVPAAGSAADFVLGQPDFTSRTAGATASDMTHLAGPVGLADDGTHLYVADRDLGRVQVYALPLASNDPSPSTTLGSGAGANGLTLHSPSAIAVDLTAHFTSQLYIADAGDNRVVIVSSVSRLSQ